MSTHATQSILANIFAEMKARSFYISFSTLCCFFSAYCNSTQLTYLFLLSSMTQARQEMRFIFTDVYEAFSSILSVCAMSTLFLIIPFVVYQIVCFFLPSCFSFERDKYTACALMILTSYVAYIFFIHLFFLPELCDFFFKFQIRSGCLTVVMEPKILSYVSWSSHVFLLALLFFLVVLAFAFLIVHHVLDIRQWAKQRKFYLWMALLAAALVSPPDASNQLLLGFIIAVVCELLIWGCFLRCTLDKYKRIS